jgi:hypothetical protein
MNEKLFFYEKWFFRDVLTQFGCCLAGNGFLANEVLVTQASMHGFYSLVNVKQHFHSDSDRNA